MSFDLLQRARQALGKFRFKCPVPRRPRKIPPPPRNISHPQSLPRRAPIGEGTRKVATLLGSERFIRQVLAWRSDSQAERELAVPSTATRVVRGHELSATRNPTLAARADF